MRISLTPELEEFRASVRRWVEENAVQALRGVDERAVRGGAEPAAVREWTRRLAERRFLCASWGTEWGGGGLSRVQVVILNEELARAHLPRITRGMGEALVGPAIIAHGTEEQKRHFLPRIISGEDRYCQGFSEPNAGCDLAGLQSRGEIVGDEVVVTGQKIWTSLASSANMIFCLCRTDPGAPKHRGISYVLVPMGEGVEVRPIHQITGEQEFFEVFLDAARAPLFNVIGGLNNGWRVAMTTLAHERGSSATVQHLRFLREFWSLVDTARALGRAGDPLVRQDLAWAYTHVELMRYTGQRVLAQLMAGAELGPEASVNKLFWSEYHCRLGEIAMSLAGAAGVAWSRDGGEDLERWRKVLLEARGETIAQGTSEIQRNIIAERVLGLPKELDGARGER